MEGDGWQRIPKQRQCPCTDTDMVFALVCIVTHPLHMLLHCRLAVPMCNDSGSWKRGWWKSMGNEHNCDIEKINLLYFQKSFHLNFLIIFMKTKPTAACSGKSSSASVPWFFECVLSRTFFLLIALYRTFLFVDYIEEILISRTRLAKLSENMAKNKHQSLTFAVQEVFNIIFLFSSGESD